MAILPVPAKAPPGAPSMAVTVVIPPEETAEDRKANIDSVKTDLAEGIAFVRQTLQQLHDLVHRPGSVNEGMRKAEDCVNQLAGLVASAE